MSSSVIRVRILFATICDDGAGRDLQDDGERASSRRAGKGRQDNDLGGNGHLLGYRDDGACRPAFDVYLDFTAARVCHIRWLSHCVPAWRSWLRM